MLQSHQDWIPSLHLDHNEIKVTNTARFSRRSTRDRQRRETEERTQRQEEFRVKIEFKAVAEEEEEATAQREVDESGQEEDAMVRDDVHCVETVAECNFCERRRDEINRLLEENRQLKRELDERKMTEFFLEDDDVKVKYYSGLPSFGDFLVLLTHVMASLPQGRRILTPFQMLLLTFMRLRLDLPVQHIAHLFRVDQRTVTTAFSDTICVLYTHLSSSVRWPDRETLRASMPDKFVKAFGDRVAIIVDCFEVFTEEPSNLQARAQTVSNDKRHHTRKYLIGITPQGVISFVSKGCGGCASDKHVTENCGFLEKLLPGDMVLAHQGFDINESVGMMCAEVKIPAFTKGQMDVKDVEEMREMAHLRFHVKRAISSVCNKYKILSGTIPLSMVQPREGEDVTFLDKVVTICCALTNMCPGVVY